MLRSIVAGFAVTAILASGVSLADTDTTIDFTGTYVRPYTPSITGTFSGDLVIDTTTGTVVSASIADAGATYNVTCIPGSCGFATSNLFVEDNHYLVTQTSLVGVTTLTPAAETGTYNGIPMTDYGAFDTHSAADANCGGIACIMSSIEYSVPGSPPASAPEIDSSIAASALTLLLGGFAVIRGRKRVFHAVGSPAI